MVAANGLYPAPKTLTPPLLPLKRASITRAYLKGPLAVTEGTDVPGCELFDYGLASELLLHHLACKCKTSILRKREDESAMSNRRITGTCRGGAEQSCCRARGKLMSQKSATGKLHEGRTSRMTI